jgi:type I restriction enzyme S subunit
LASRADYYGGDIPWLIIEDLNDGIVTKAARSITQSGLDNSSAKVLPVGTLLIAMYGSIGKLGITGLPCATNQAIAFCKCDAGQVDTRFLFFLLLHERIHFINAGRGGTQQNINGEFLKDYEISIPSLTEQRRIAGRLEQADRLRRTRRYALELTDTLLPAAFRQLFASRLKAGPFRALGELVKITGGGTPARERPEFYQGQIPWLTSKDMKGDFIWDTEEHITEKAIQESSTNLVPAESILVVVKSKVLMHRLPVAISKVALCHGQDIKSIQCSGDLRPEFARFVLKFHERRLLNLARGANTEGLTLPMLQELSVPTVPGAEQDHFSELVTRHERLRAVQRESLRQAEHLFASLLHRAFSG